MGMKPPKKIVKTDTPDTDPPFRPISDEDSTLSRVDVAGPGIAAPGTSSSSNRRPDSEPDNVARQPQVMVADVSSSGQSATSSVVARSEISFLPTLLAASLPAPLANGLRYGKRQTVYAEIENEGITLVRRRNSDEYQATSANELIATGPVLERVSGTPFWRRKDPADGNHLAVDSSADEQPGPSTRKRPRVDEDTDTASETDSLIAQLSAQNAGPLDLSSALWRNWGTSTKPHAVETLEIDGLHYRVVPRGWPEQTGLALLEHPRFSPARYEAFERMLQDDSSLQPRWAVKNSNGKWEVLENHLPFDKSLTGYVADTFRDFSEASLTTVARTLFNRADHSEVINKSGLMVLKQTFRNWADANNAHIPRRELADPLLMLPVIPRTINNGWIALTPPDASGALRRLDFAPEHFPGEWRNFAAAPSDYNLKRLVGSVLVRNGYDVFPLTSEHRWPTLVFTRVNHDAVFFLKLGRIQGDAVRDITPPGNELSDPLLASRIGESARSALRTAYDQNKVVWLLGGTQITASGWQSVFMIREG
ncbi:hypothetical protein ACYZT9_10290 [Pseudomonas sp. ZT5P21]